LASLPVERRLKASSSIFVGFLVFGGSFYSWLNVVVTGLSRTGTIDTPTSVSADHIKEAFSRLTEPSRGRSRLR
jgi:hypothetical protein